MDWRRLLNPWAEMRRLEAHNARLEQLLDQMWSDLQDAERAAFWKAQQHFDDRTKHLRGQNEDLLKKLVDISNLTPHAHRLRAKP